MTTAFQKIQKYALLLPKKIVERAANFVIPTHDIVVDPLVMPIGAMHNAMAC